MRDHVQAVHVYPQLPHVSTHPAVLMSYIAGITNIRARSKTYEYTRYNINKDERAVTRKLRYALVFLYTVRGKTNEELKSDR